MNSLLGFLTIMTWIVSAYVKAKHAVKWATSPKYRQDVKAEREQEHEDEIYGRD